jgi:hypothetical protein
MATILQVLGALGISIGAGFIYPPVGIILAGTFALLFGLAARKEITKCSTIFSSPASYQLSDHLGHRWRH